MPNAQIPPNSQSAEAIARKKWRHDAVADLARKINALSDSLPNLSGFEDAGFQMADLASDAAVIIMENGESPRGAFLVDSEILAIFECALSSSTLERMELTPEHLPELFYDWFLLRKARREGALIEEAMKTQQMVDGQSHPVASKTTSRL